MLLYIISPEWKGSRNNLKESINFSKIIKKLSILKLRNKRLALILVLALIVLLIF